MNVKNLFSLIFILYLPFLTDAKEWTYGIISEDSTKCITVAQIEGMMKNKMEIIAIFQNERNMLSLLTRNSLEEKYELLKRPNYTINENDSSLIVAMGEESEPLHEVAESALKKKEKLKTNDENSIFWRDDTLFIKFFKKQYSIGNNYTEAELMACSLLLKNDLEKRIMAKNEKIAKGQKYQIHSLGKMCFKIMAGGTYEEFFDNDTLTVEKEGWRFKIKYIPMQKDINYMFSISVKKAEKVIKKENNQPFGLIKEDEKGNAVFETLKDKSEILLRENKFEKYDYETNKQQSQSTLK
jgi:hypothetical protein